jgi:putative addiction module component (TIGR02574 family)
VSGWVVSGSQSGGILSGVCGTEYHVLSTEYGGCEGCSTPIPVWSFLSAVLQSVQFMSTASEVLQSALSLPPQERAEIAYELLQSLPGGPTTYETEEQLAAELSRRMQAIENGSMETFDFEDTMRRAREALERSRR